MRKKDDFLLGSFVIKETMCNFAPHFPSVKEIKK